MKPKGCKYPDCFNCTLSDCRYDVPEEEDFERDKAITERATHHLLTDKQRRGKINQKKYRSSDKYKKKMQEYKENGKDKEYRLRYTSKESAKELHRIRVKNHSDRQSEKLGMPYATFRDYQKRYGITESDVKKGMLIQKVSSDGRIKIPQRIVDSGILCNGDTYKVYTWGKKVVLEKLEIKN